MAALRTLQQVCLRQTILYMYIDRDIWIHANLYTYIYIYIRIFIYLNIYIRICIIYIICCASIAVFTTGLHNQCRSNENLRCSFGSHLRICGRMHLGRDLETA